MKLNRYTVQIVTVLALCGLLAMALVPSMTTGEVHDSISKFTKALGAMASSILYGALAGGQDNKEEGHGE